jgi:hypothetical protein
MELLLGHNQFIGISHISDERSREREKKFSNVKDIYNIIEKATEMGYEGMIIETHPRILEFLDYYKNNKSFDIDFYLQIPYIHGYIQKMNENGLMSLIGDIIYRSGLKRASRIAVKNMINLTKKDYISLALSFLELEIIPFIDLNIKAVLLHNVITDIFLSLGMSDCLKGYIEYLSDELDLKSGFITLNFHSFQCNINRWKIKPPLVMTPINPGGFDMNPSKEAVEMAINKYKGEIIAMNILGGGAFTVEKTRDYMKSLRRLKICVVGASSEKHLLESANIFKYI